MTRTGSVADELRASKKQKLTEAQAIADKAANFSRSMSPNEERSFDELVAEAASLEVRAAEIEAGEKRGSELEESFRAATGAPFRQGAGTEQGHARYGLPKASLRSHFDAIAGGSTATSREEFRAMVTTSGMGAATSWASKAASPAVSLREFAGITVRPLDGLSAQHPSVTLPAGSGTGAAESAQHTEVTGVAASTLTATRYGAWSNASAAVRTFDDLTALVAAHAVHISRSLTLADVGTIDAQAGAATLYAAATFEQTLRETVLTVAATAGVEPTDLVVYGQPAALAVASGYSPTNGEDRGSVVQRLFGARIFPIIGATASQLTFFAPSGFLAFESGMGGATTVDPKDGSSTFGSWLHSTAAGPAIVGAAKAIATA